MAQQRNPKVGDIVTTSKELLASYKDEYGAEDNYPVDKYLVVASINEFRDGSVVYLRAIGKDIVCTEEYLLYFHNYYDIVENATEETIQVLYGNKGR